MSLEAVLAVLPGAAAVGYLAAWTLVLLRRDRIGRAMAVLAWLANLGLFIGNWLATGEPPLGNMGHAQAVLGLSFLPLWAFLAWREKMEWTLPYFLFTAALPLVGALCMDAGRDWKRVPALQSPWFVPHVLAYMFGYALAAVGFAMSVAGWWRARVRKAGGGETHREAAHQIVRLGFPFLTFGLLSGALWAEEAWGAYWSWDPKETWSLITWTLYVIYLHCRRDARTDRWADLAQALAFLALLTTFFLVNLLPRLASALHSYA
jgi:ABC-type transport system involved in cytochrome c biogenesis permease subunit